MHTPQGLIAAALQGQMKLRTEIFAVFQGRAKIRIYRSWLQRAKPHPHIRHRLANGSDQVLGFLTVFEISAPR